MRNGEEYVLKITRASLNKMLSPADGNRVPTESIAVLDNLERIANNGVWFDSQGDRKNRTQINGIDHLKTTVYIDGSPYEIDMRVRLVQENARSAQDNVLYYFTPEEVVSIKKVGTAPPTGERRALTGASEGVPTSSAPIIADSSAGGNTQSAQSGPESSTGGFGPNTVGSAENPFKSAPKVSKVETNTFENGGIYNDVDKQMAGVKPEDLTYDPVSERQSMSHALDRLVNDFEGEKADLPNKEAWSGEDLDTAMGILYQMRQQGKQTGDYSEFNRWRKLIQEKGTNAG